MTRQDKYLNEPVAIVGSACRFPGNASSPSKLWDLLREPRDVLSPIPQTRFEADKFYHPDPLHDGTSNVRHSYVLSEDHRVFDAQFFDVKPIEANALDPQQRILLETSYEALESAGLPIEKLKGAPVGVYIGLMNEDYSEVVGQDLSSIPTYFASGTARSTLSNRVSYFFDFRGPSMTIDTACSSSLVALHQAVQALRGGEITEALVAGANLLLAPGPYVAASKLKMLSPSGRSRMWDTDADGYARADGFAVLVLKTLSRALADGDSIQCLIRETGVNQDGKTKGITMPSASAQASLIRATYQRAGLDLSKASDRPQYFEAHGTGTQAGDPIEAEAISTVFFGDRATGPGDQSEPPLYVGSIKTILGHSEGTAGVAGVLKTAMALKNGIIPPNMLLNKLSPRVEPFYTHLQIPQDARAWQTVQDGPRRASVNSFGFGGTNAHAILESFEGVPSHSAALKHGSDDAILAPFLFSAASEKSLAKTLRDYADFLTTNPETDLRDLAWTLSTRRSVLPFRQSISAFSIHDLISKLQHAAETPKSSPVSHPEATPSKPKLLGIFTGQGAQWPAMGATLLKGSQIARRCFETLQESLDSLPDGHAPSWSLQDELLRAPENSRVLTGEISQPLTTAVQICLVQLLKAAGIDFTAVVGHSSGEIAAAYAAGYISAADAIRISYYRGLSLVMADVDRKGAMIAVGTTLEDAQELCQLPLLRGKVSIAAHNSHTSVTLSGDADAIQDVLEIMEDEGKFARLLKVDKAYHSYHMLPCADFYTKALESCQIGIQPRDASKCPVWISSVVADDVETLTPRYLQNAYWSDNMVNSVLFSKAIELACGINGPVEAAIEVGPHAALRAPASDTFREMYGKDIPYFGTLKRGENDIGAFADCLGSLWTAFGPEAIDFSAFDQITRPAQASPPRLLQNLPTYPWNHDRLYWHDTRLGKAMQTHTGGLHPLVGALAADETKQEARFKKLVSPKEFPWLMNHQIQGEIVFPASAYVAAVVEAIDWLHRDDPVQLIDMTDLTIGKALVFADGNSKVETLLSMKSVEKGSGCRDWVFSYYSWQDKSSTSLVENASGKVRVTRGLPPESLLPPPYTPQSHQFLPIDPEIFYDAVETLGHGYTGDFRGLAATSRRMDEAVGFLPIPQTPATEVSLTIHPSTLDCAVQAIMLAFCYPGDGRLRSLHVPTKIARIRIGVTACRNATSQSEAKLPFYASVHNQSQPSAELVGDVEIHCPGSDHTIIQMEGLQATPLDPPSDENDAKIFYEMTWSSEALSGTTIDWSEKRFANERALSPAIERVAFFYLQKIGRAFPADRRSNLKWHHICLMRYVDHCMAEVAAGIHPYVTKECVNDTEDYIISLINQFPSSIDLRLMEAVGGSILPSMRGESEILEALTRDNMLGDFYSRALGMATYLDDMSRVVRLLSRRFPHMNVLEIGAGTAGATTPVIQALQSSFASYTFTDVSTGFFEQAQSKFAANLSRMHFKVLDIEKDPAEQGFREGSYDLIIASLVLHATRNLDETLAHTRRLLKPGGFLVLLEVTSNDAMHIGLICGGLPSWWAGQDDGRLLSPCVSAPEWDLLMRRNNFSGIDAMTPHNNQLAVPLSLIVSQAVDDRIRLLREPRGVMPKSLTIVGTGEVLDAMRGSLGGHFDNIQISPSLESLALQQLPPGGTVVGLADLAVSSPFHAVTAKTLEGLKQLFKKSSTIVWASCGALSGDPYKNMFRGLQRSVVLEAPQVRIQTIDFATAADIQASIIVQSVMRLEVYSDLHSRAELKDILWSCEPEILVQGGELLVPRMQPSPARNKRYNSARRLLTRKVSPDTTTLSVRLHGSAYTVDEMQNHRRSRSLSDDGEVQLTHSLLMPVPVTDTSSGFLSLGELVGSGKPVIVLSKTLDSHIHPHPSWTLAAPKTTEVAVQALACLGAYLTAQKILSYATPRKTLVVLNPDLDLGEALRKLGAEQDIRMLLLTTSTKRQILPWVKIHARSSRLSLQRLLPSAISAFIDWAGSSELSTTIRSIVPPNCPKLDRSSFINPAARLELDIATVRTIADNLQTNYLKALEAHYGWTTVEPLPMLTLGELALHRGSGHDTQSCLSWKAESVISIPEKPLGNQLSFSPDKSYWLVGLTGGLGTSLCQWMAARGARHVALSSRSPRVDLAWLEHMAAQGCTVKVFASDATDRESVQKTYKAISEQMPPVGGVAQGAMVLQDSLFSDMDLERMQNVLKPKVNASVYLDEIFSEDTLDFFVLFSSIAYVVGNIGQSAYTAGNAFIASLAANRRARGLAGSVINIGAVVGEGYVTRRLSRAKQLNLQKGVFEFMSEQAFHEVFAEGVQASHLASNESFEISTGLRMESQSPDEETSALFSNPIFQKLIQKQANQGPGGGKSKSVALIKERLLEATSRTQALEIIKDGFLTKLRSALQAELPDDEAMSKSPDGLGIDSLIAVELRGWLFQNTGIDFSIMKLLNAPSIQHLLHDAAELFELAIDREDHTSSDMHQKDAIGNIDQPERVLELQSHDAIVSDSVSTDFSGASSTTLSETKSVDADPSRTNSPAPLGSLDDIRSKAFDLTTEVGFIRSVPMSFAQTGFWFLNSFVENQAAFNVTTVLRLRGKIDISRFNDALVAVAQRHEILRTVFYTDLITKKHMQGVLLDSVLRVEHTMLPDELQVEDEIRGMQDHTFDLSKGEMLRLKVLSLPNDLHIVILGYHHIALDGISNQVFLRDLEKAYSTGHPDSSSGPVLQYADFTLRQIREYAQGTWTKELDYWRSQFLTPSPPLPFLSLARRRVRPDKPRFASYSAKIRLDRVVSNQIDQCCARFRIAPFHFYLAVFAVFLYRWTDRTEHLCIGVADHNRKDTDVLSSLGLFLNLIPLRVQCSDDRTFASTLKSIKALSDDAFANSRVPIDVLLKELSVPRMPSRTPLFQAMFNYHQNVQDVRTFCGCEGSGELVAAGEHAYDVSLDILNSASQETIINIGVNTELYSQDDADILKRSYVELLKSFSYNPATRIVHPPLYHAPDSSAIVKLGTGPESSSTWPATMVDRIDFMASTYKDTIALRDSQKRLTYEQMSARTNQVASLLLAAGVTSGACVGIFQNPSSDWICSLLGIWRIGACCVPLDRELGSSRLALVMNDCKPAFIVVDSAAAANEEIMQSTGTRVIDLSTMGAVYESISPVPSLARSSDKAIITYTSGTTGGPKGVVLHHSSYTNFVEFAPPRWGFQEGVEVVLQSASYAFDMSLCQILVCLGYGGTLVIPDSGQRRDPAAICGLIASEGVTFTLATPTEYLAWIRYKAKSSLIESRWSGAMSGGEPVDEPLVQAFRSLQKPNFRLIDAYGPCETTFACADQIIPLWQDQYQPNGLLSLLTPLPNSSIHVVDENMQVLPVGIPGQVLIGGAGVAGGYMNRPDLTATEFPNNTYASKSFQEKGWTTIHLSGDRGVFDASGHLRLLGRMPGSTQVKIGGVRMDLQEIENAIAAVPHVIQVAVSCRKSSSSRTQTFAAFVTLDLAKSSEERQAYADQIPQLLPLAQSMRPSIMVVLNDIPRTMSGKVDRTAIDEIALPSNISHVGQNATFTDGVEGDLWSLWKEAIPGGISSHHEITEAMDFFLMNGNSLALIELQYLIRERLGVIVSLDQLFRASTMGEMARLIRHQADSIPASQMISWEEEVAVEPEILKLGAIGSISPPVKASPEIIVLTGSTGFIGGEILQRFVEDETIRKIYCIAVRKQSQQLPTLCTHQKVSVHSGDLSARHLGLTDHEVDEIFSTADAVVHVGADTSFLKTYRSLRPINHGSTKELARLSLPRRIPLHFVSTAAVARLTGLSSMDPVSVAPYPPPPTYADEEGYVSTKWASEVYLERVSEQCGLPVTIHRPSSVLGKGAPGSDLMSNLLKFARMTKSVPAADGWHGYLDFVSVATVADTIVNNVMMKPTKRAGVQYLYESGEAVLTMNELQQSLEMSGIGSVDVLPVTEWVDRLLKAGMDPLFGVYLRRTGGDGPRFTFPKLHKGDTSEKVPVHAPLDTAALLWD